MVAWRGPCAFLLACTLLVAACGTRPDSEELPGRPISMGAFDFAESRILAELYAQALRDGGVSTGGISQLTGREGTFPALQSGEIDFLPEYNGNALDFISAEEVAHTDVETITEELRAALEELGLTVLESSPAENRDELVVTRETAERFDLVTVSDLVPVAEELTAGGPIEFTERNTGLPGLREVYGIEFDEFVRTDAGGPDTIEKLRNGTVDVARLFSTDPRIAENGWVVLVEDEPFSLPNAVTPVVREDVATARVVEIVNAVSAALTTDDLVAFNRRFTLEEASPDAIAREFLARKGLP